MAPSFSPEDVQKKLEAILASGNRQATARCTLFCAELVEAARQDERQQMRDRNPSSSNSPRLAGVDGGAWTRGFFGESFLHSKEASKFAQQPTLDKCNTERTSDRDCEWVLRTAFTIRNKVTQRRQESAEADVPEVVDEGVARRRAVSMSKRPPPATVLDPELVERIGRFRNMVQLAMGLWQERLLDEDKCLSRSATTRCDQKPKAKAGKRKWAARTMAVSMDAGPLAEPVTGQSPFRHLIAPSRDLSANNLELPNDGAGDRISASSNKSVTPKSRKELHEDLGRELEQLAKDLRSAQIIKSC
mmetsp:Transcript_55837/g.130383  ORF Transcript_55837/g.130383 Transcript_55837/m.130383 type:complete len:303 (+) Transcript_55837:45-953(+)